MYLNKIFETFKKISNLKGPSSIGKKRLLIQSLIEKTNGLVLCIFDKPFNRLLNLASANIKKITLKSSVEKLTLKAFLKINLEIARTKGKESVQKKVLLLNEIYQKIDQRYSSFLNDYYVKKRLRIGFDQKLVFNCLTDIKSVYNTKQELKVFYAGQPYFGLYKLFKIIKKNKKVPSLIEYSTIKPLLASIFRKPLKNEKFYIEPKLDGFRALIKKKNGKITCWTRSGKKISVENIFEVLAPDVAEDLRKIEDDYILDGELWTPSKKKGLGFNLISPLIMSKIVPLYLKKIKVFYTPFDVLYFKKDLTKETYIQRRKILVDLNIRSTIDSKYVGSFETFSNLGLEKKDQYEGYILKEQNSKYWVDTRTTDWLKIKDELTFEVQILKGHKGSGKYENYFTSFDIFVLDKENLAPIGQVGTGFSEQQLKYLKNVDFNTSPFIVQIKAEAVTKAKNRLNYSLRFPSFLRFRPDKDKPSELKEIKALF